MPPRGPAPWAASLRHGCVLLLCRGALAGLSPFGADSLSPGVERFQHDVFVPAHYLEPADGGCSSLEGPRCTALHGAREGPAPSGVFALFGGLPGDPGFFVQDEVGHYFAEGGRAAAAEPPARCLRVAFDRLPPHLAELPGTLAVAPGLSVEVVGSFALSSLPHAAIPGERPAGSPPRAAQAVFAEVREAIAYLRFSGPVTVEQVWVSRAPSSQAARNATAMEEAGQGRAKPSPVVLRGRNGPDEQWSAYLREEDFEKGWVTPLSLSALPVKEVVLLGGQGLRISSVCLSQLVPAAGGAAADAALAPAAAARAGWVMTPAESMRSMQEVAISKITLPSAAAMVSVAEAHRTGGFRLRAGLLDEEDEESAAGGGAWAVAESEAAAEQQDPTGPPASPLLSLEVGCSMCKHIFCCYCRT